MGFPGGTKGKESTSQWRRCKRCRFNPWVRKILWSRKWEPILVFLPGKFHGQRRTVGYNLWGHKESNRTEWLTLSLSRFSCVQHFATYELWSREYWSGLPFPASEDLPDPGIESISPVLSTLAGTFFTTSATWEAQCFSSFHQWIAFL